MSLQIFIGEKQDYLALLEVWEQSVRATHSFLSDDEINKLKPQILGTYFDETILRVCKSDDGNIIGFIGILANKIEMLFISPKAQGKGVGSALCKHAFEQHGVTKVDVNEQNPRAKDFYIKLGFKVISRSELDGQGKPYPILHMEKI